MLLSLLLLLLHQETTAVTTVINNCFRYKGGRPTIGSAAAAAAVVLVGYCSVKHHHPIDHHHRLLLSASSVVDIRYINHKYWKLTHWRLFLPSLSMISMIILFECWTQCMMIYRLCCIVISFNWCMYTFYHFLALLLDDVPVDDDDDNSWINNYVYNQWLYCFAPITIIILM